MILNRKEIDGETMAKRTKEIDKAIGSISGMFGDLQGIIGPSLSNVKVLSLPDYDEEE